MSDSDTEVELSNQHIASFIRERRKPRPTWREVKENYLMKTGD